MARGKRGEPSAKRKRRQVIDAAVGKQALSKITMSREDLEAYVDQKLTEMFPPEENPPGGMAEQIVQRIASYTESNGKPPKFIVISSTQMRVLKEQTANNPHLALRERNGKPHIAGVHVIDPLTGNADLLCGR